MMYERRCWAQVDMDALRHNFKVVQKAAGGTPVMAVVKADAYGHGDAAVARLFAEEGAAAFAVSNITEAQCLRRAGVDKPILILGYTAQDYAATLARLTITQTVYSLAYAQRLSEAAVGAGITLQVHLKIDTGMGRLGFCVRDDFDAAIAEMETVSRLPGLQIDGLFTHFAVADSVSGDDPAYTERQHALLVRTVAALKQRGITPQTVHCCNSAATFVQPAFHHDMVRAGIILYGENPSSETTLPGLRPAMQLKAVISQVKDICAGDAESYGRTFTASTPMRVATVTVGYADGYARLLSNTGTMSVRGCPARILGRVCMDQTIVDVTNIPDAAEGDEVTVYGGAAADSVERVAELTGTINYEVVCAVSRRVPRVYVAQGREVACANYLTGE